MFVPDVTRLWPPALLCLAVAACGGKSAPTYETHKVDRGRIAPKVTATGTVSATVTVQVGSQVSGRVAALYADFNSAVDAGATIARIDPQLFEAALEQARANHMAAQGNLARSQVQAADADRQFQRAKSLADRQLVAQADLDTARATAEAAKAQIDVSRGNLAQAKAALHQAEVNLTYTTIASPISGTVISRNVDVGQTVAASLSAPTLFVIAEDLRKMQVDTAVAEADVGKLQPGMDATFVVDAFPGERFRGKVRQIRNAPTTVQNVVTYDAVIDVENPELKLRPGMTANVTFIWAERNDVIRVPNAALRFKPSAEALKKSQKGDAPPAPEEGKRPRGPKGASDEKTVYLLKNVDELSPATVKIGVTDGTVTEVLSGLSEGDLVITESNDPSAPKPQRGSGGPPGGGMRRMF
ncbi:MAG: efflux RND transporter periplasmic adaptor subunit [Myxococcaceae bacterium]|nr:efflux RND transporter periplasmic adaptor subunit [Myxococcaceae bacterium]